jgi:hypothetical protein
MKTVHVITNWKGKKAINLPEGKKYITVAKFPEDKNWPHEAWSMVLEFEIIPKKQGNPSKAMAHFLFNEAPQERLIGGNKFELYEGADLVAKVEVE